MVCPAVHAVFRGGDHLEVDIDSGTVKNLTTGKSLKAEPLPPNIQAILKKDGLVEVTGERLGRAARA